MFPFREVTITCRLSAPRKTSTRVPILSYFNGDDGTEVAADAFAGVVALADEGLNFDGDAPLSSSKP